MLGVIATSACREGHPGQREREAAGALGLVAPAEIRSLLPTKKGTNVLVVSFDALRTDALGVYGYGRGISPHIDAFSEYSLVFDRAYTAAPVTPTSFAAAFSGQYPFRTFRGWQFTAESSAAKVFAEAGYATAAFLNNVQLTAERGFDLGFTSFTVDPEQNQSDEAILRKTIAWLEDHRDRRFFLWVHFINPHAPYDRRRMAARFYDPAYRGRFAATTGRAFEPESPSEAARVRSLYDGEVFFVDSLFGRLQDQIKSLGLWSSTTIVLTSDHGEEFGERGGYQHQHLFEETIRIPLVIHHPAMTSGARTDLLVTNADLLPTLAGIADLPVEHAVDGRDVRLIQLTDPREVISTAMTERIYRAVALLRGTYKLILQCQPEIEVQLYDLNIDPHERKNLVQEDRRSASDLARALQREMGNDPCASIAQAVAGVSPEEGISDKTIRALRSLGYLED